MNWPFVTRSRLEHEQRHVKLLKAMLTEVNEDLKEQREGFVKRYDGLLNIMLEMKREGFEPIPKAIELVPEKELPPEIWEAINAVSAKNTRDYYTNMAHAYEALEAGVSREDVIHQIIYGQKVDV